MEEYREREKNGMNEMTSREEELSIQMEERERREGEERRNVKNRE